MNTSWRRVVILLTALLFFGGIIGFQILSRQKSDPPRKSPITRSLLTVRALSVTNGSASMPIPLQGRLVAFDRVDLFAEVNGQAMEGAHALKEGVRFQKGEVLVQLDDREARLALMGQRAALLTLVAQVLPDIKIEFPDRFPAWQTYVEQLDPEKRIADLPTSTTTREKLFLAGRGIQSQFYSIRSAEERLTKYRLIAPFDGMLTAVDIQRGTLVRPGQRIGQFLRSGAYELESSTSIGDLAFIRIGQKVSLVSEDNGKVYSGLVRRIGDQVEASTQMVPIFIEVGGQGLREGMFLSGEIQGGISEQVVALPKELLMNGREIWRIQDSSLVKVQVHIIRTGRTLAIVDGLEDGTLVVRDHKQGMVEGQKVNWIID
ncbi:MAG: HlyD family efflux transporter periplasmic adaptor subunit [Saprospiraceae bacterium]|nr:HlyD family efflux transporter periplasmic adaptor subunit [Saprospiraceae bacterium]